MKLFLIVAGFPNIYNKLDIEIPRSKNTGIPHSSSKSITFDKSEIFLAIGIN